uniref:Exonuclease domain-containing protein n=1 Tax=Heterorhabditis bacteriophora TaxID=37862 RepID=A0A1I7XG61_HETBA
MQEYATLMGLTNGNPTIASAVNDPLKPKNSSTNSDNSVKCGLKRTSNISISPKKMMKKLFNGEPFRTFIFMDLETTGIFPRSSGQQYPIHPMGKPHEFSSALNRLILESTLSFI